MAYRKKITSFLFVCTAAMRKRINTKKPVALLLQVVLMNYGRFRSA
jgi:formate/nitrite transporter FocA (FNT family)